MEPLQLNAVCEVQVSHVDEMSLLVQIEVTRWSQSAEPLGFGCFTVMCYLYEIITVDD